jgi:hypothetical protein
MKEERVVIKIASISAYDIEKDMDIIQLSITTGVLGEKINTVDGFSREIKDMKLRSFYIEKFSKEKDLLKYLSDMINSFK